MSLQFEWDKRKASTNLRKHKISFDEATTVFDDPLAAIFNDEDHSADDRPRNHYWSLGPTPIGGDLFYGTSRRLDPHS